MHSKNIIAVARIFVTLKSLEPNPTVPRLRLGGTLSPMVECQFASARHGRTLFLEPRVKAAPDRFGFRLQISEFERVSLLLLENDLPPV
jgi:hypothetical protein